MENVYFIVFAKSEKQKINHWFLVWHHMAMKVEILRIILKKKISPNILFFSSSDFFYLSISMSINEETYIKVNLSIFH